MFTTLKQTIENPVSQHKKLRAMSEEEVGSHAHRVVLVSRHVLETAEETQFINYSKDKIAATFVLEYQGKMRVVGLGTGKWFTGQARSHRCWGTSHRWLVGLGSERWL